MEWSGVEWSGVECCGVERRLLPFTDRSEVVGYGCSELIAASVARRRERATSRSQYSFDSSRFCDIRQRTNAYK